MSGIALFCSIVLMLVFSARAAPAQTDPGGIDRTQSQMLERLAKAHPLPLLPATVINYDGGGLIYEYDARWHAVATQGSPVEVRGLCESACTLVTAHVPKDRICFGPLAALNFHMARASSTDNTPDMRATQWMIDSYPPDIRGWIVARGGIASMPRIPMEYWSLPARQLWEMGYKRCSN